MRYLLLVLAAGLILGQGCPPPESDQSNGEWTVVESPCGLFGCACPVPDSQPAETEEAASEGGP